MYTERLSQRWRDTTPFEQCGFDMLLLRSLPGILTDLAEDGEILPLLNSMDWHVTPFTKLYFLDHGTCCNIDVRVIWMLGDCCRVQCVSICPFFSRLRLKLVLCVNNIIVSSFSLFTCTNQLPAWSSSAVRIQLKWVSLLGLLLWSASHWWIMKPAGILRWVLYIVWTVSIGYILLYFHLPTQLY